MSDDTPMIGREAPELPAGFLPDVAAGRVMLWPTGEIRRYFDDGTYTTAATKQYRALVDAGLVERGQEHPAPPGERNPRYVLRLTPEGERVLAEHLGSIDE